MTMADQIAVMNGGKVEQLGAPADLYERPDTAFVASFLGISNLLAATVESPGRLRLADGSEIAVAPNGRTGRVAAGIRPEKIRLDGSGQNTLAGVVAETAYIGVATQALVDTAAGRITVFAQNSASGGPPVVPGARITLGWEPECTFVVDPPEEEPA